MNLSIRPDCIHFKNDRPCAPHKETGVHCVNCTEYKKKGPGILIIKLASIGDVLRTTSILNNLCSDFPNARITWVTKGKALTLFKHNFMVQKVIDADSQECLVTILSEEYDLAINLDSMPESAKLVTIARAKRKLGFGYAKEGHVYPFNVEARKWFLMGLFDDFKKDNRQSYQELMLEICQTNDRHIYKPILIFDDQDRLKARKFHEEQNLSNYKPIIGINTGAGGRWQHKKWTEEHILQFCRLVREQFPDSKVLLYGGSEEYERNSSLAMQSPDNVTDTGCDHELREFAAFVELCDVMITGDTLAMHIAIALRKYAIVLFGPTSHAEIYLYGRGIKVFPDLQCLVCYRETCNKQPSCMELIEPDRVIYYVQLLLKHENINR